MAKHEMSAPQQRQVLTGIERLALRVSAMINHPAAQIQRRVTIHRLDSDPEPDWEQIMEMLAAIDELDLVFNDDETVTVRWDCAGDQDYVVHERDIEAAPSVPPF
jgi:hypothetical protein